MKTKFIIISLFCFGLWLISFIKFAVAVNNDIEEKDAKTDVIVVLTGGAKRVDEALSLLSEDKADILFISGVYKGTSLKSITPLSIPNKTIVLGKAAQNTLENAQETANFIDRNNFKSIRLVTSSYHMQRSILDVKTIIPNITIIPHPVFSENFKKETWWQNPKNIYLVVKEHAKYNFALLRHFVFDIFNIAYNKITSVEDTKL